MRSLNNISIALFGSTARGDEDALSDRDIFVACAEPRDALEVVADFKRVGWSPTVYTWSRLDAAICRGDLFVQHLRQEGRILLDPDRQLQSVLSTYRPRTCYKREREASGSLLGILEFFPESYQGRLWAFDVAAVAFRSLAVAHLADNGLYCFAPQDIVGGLRRLGLATSELFAIVSRLREGKAAYRRGNSDLKEGVVDIYILIDAIDKCFKLGLHVKPISPQAFVNRAVSQGISSSDWYEQTRLLEMAISMLQTDDDVAKANLDEWNTRLRAPSEYGGYLSANCFKIARELQSMVTLGSLRLKAGDA